MAHVTFIGASRLEQAQPQVHSTRGASLLSLAMIYGIPLPCNCAQGRCGTCAVKVATKPPGGGGRIRLSGKEKQTLLAAGKISQMEYRAESLPIHPPLWRLACEYRIEDEDIVVAF